MSLEQITIAVDEQWVLNLVEKLQKYEMFKDQRQKIVEAILTAEADEQAAKRGAVTQNMVELWCAGHGVKMVRREDLVMPSKYEGETCIGLSKCPGVWIKPFQQLTEDFEKTWQGVEGTPEVGECGSHVPCTDCWNCIDGQGWVDDAKFVICGLCRDKRKDKGRFVPKQCPLANVNRPKLGTVRKVVIPDEEDTVKKITPKKVVAKKTLTKIAPAKKTSVAKAPAKKPVATKKAPAKPATWVEFAAKRRGELKVSKPDLSHSELTKIISAEWKIVRSNI